MKQDKPPLTLTIPSDVRMLSVARAFVEAACQIGNYDKSNTHAIVLAAGEAFTNIIRHAHHQLPDAHIKIQILFHDDSIELWFHDQGAPFDLQSVPHLNPGEIRLGGRGVYLMRTLMDELTCSQRPQGGNTLRMVKYQKSQTIVRNCG